MKGFILKEAYVHRFGKLSEYRYTFQEGVNVVNEENGWGKTTFAVFLKAMLFGLEYSRATKVVSERKRYMPYEGGIYGGTLSFCCADKSYRIERYFGKTDKEDTFVLYDLSTNLASLDYSSNIGEELWEVDRDSYEKTSFITLDESDLISDIIYHKLGDIKEKEADIQESTNAFKILEKAMITIRAKRGSSGLLEDAKRACTELERKKRECLFALKEVGSLETNQWLAEQKLTKLQEEELQWEKKLQDLSLAGKQDHYQTLLLWVEQVEKEYKRVNAIFTGSIPSQEELAEMEKVVGEYEKHYSLHEEYSQEPQEYIDCKKQAGVIQDQIQKLEEEYVNSEWNNVVEDTVSLIVVLLRVSGGFTILVSVVISILFSMILEGVLVGIIGALLLGGSIMKQKDDNRMREKNKENEAEIHKKKYEEEMISLVKRKEELQRLYTAFEKEGENRLAQVNEKLQDTNKKLTSMFAEHCKWDEDTPPRECITTLREAVKEVEYLRKQIVKQKFSLQQFKDENDVSLFEDVVTSSYTLEEIQAKKQTIVQEKKEAIEQMSDISKDYKIKIVIADQLEDVKAELAEKIEEVNQLEEQYNLLNLTYDCLNTAKDQLVSTYKAAMEEAFQKYLSKIEQSEYKEYEINIRLNILHQEEGKLRDYYTLSKGKKDLVRICLRMALVEAVYKEVDSPVIIMDDPFVNLDQDRLDGAMALLEEIGEQYQVIYFICHDSRKPSSNDWL